MSGSDYGSTDLATAYDSLSHPQFAHGNELLALLDIRRGDRLLDIGCGTGRLAVTALERVGSHGSVTGIDPAEPRIAMARVHRDPRLEFRVGRAEDLTPFADASFDVVYLNSVLNWIADRSRAMRETHRVLKPAGRLGIATTVRERPNQLHELARRAWRAARGIDETGPPKGRVAARESKNAVTEAEVRGLIETAGLALRTAEVRTFASIFRDTHEIVEFLIATTYGRLAPGAGASEYAAFEAALGTLLQRDHSEALTAEGIQLQRHVLLAVADKPSS